MSRKNTPSTISRLPPEIRDKISQLRDNNRTIDEIMAVLNTLDLDEPVSRSSLGRHLKKMEQVAGDLRRSRALAEAVGRQFGDGETSKVARINMELLHTLLMKLMIGGDDENSAPVELKPQEAMFLATAMERVTKAGKVDFEAQLLAAREQERIQATEKAAEKAVSTAIKLGASEEFIHTIKARILGVDV